jgi:hypothetical protein
MKAYSLFRYLVTAAGVGLLAVACSSKSNPTTDGGSGGCSQDLSVGWDQYALCAAGTGGNLGSACPALTPPAACINTRPVAACCAWVQDATVELARATGLHYFSAPSGQTTVDLGCLTNPGTKGTPQNVTLTGFVKLFSSGDDSAGVKVEVYNEGTDGALGTLIGSYTTVADDQIDPPQMPLPTWSSKCPTQGCTLRSYSIPNVPTETALIIKTSDATGAQKWADLYDYNIYFANAALTQGDGGVSTVSYDASTVAATDVNTVASAAGGFTIKPDKGLLAGEVHDCGDVRLTNATVNTDYRPEGDMFYFNADETNPLPDKQQTDGTSKLGLFGALNYPTGVPIHISAVGILNGQRTLIGAYTVQVYAGAVTALSLRGRRPYQHD